MNYGTALLLILLATSGTALGAMKPEDRVMEFIAEYQRRHAQVAGHDDEKQFDRWEAQVAQLDKRHFVDGGGRALANVIANDHEVDKEKIVSSSRTPNGALVETLTDFSGLSRYHEYELRQVGSDWRIVTIREYLDSADAPFVKPELRQRYENPQPLPLRALPADDSHFDGSPYFISGKHVESDGKSEAIEIRKLGDLNVTSGVLVVGDLGYRADDLWALGQRVPPGKYPAEISVAFNHVLALRVVFSNKKVVSWHPGDMGDGWNGVGVDAGNVAICDASGLLAVKARQKERLIEPFAQGPGLIRARMISFAKPDDAVITDSGNGDGSYPVYWGVDANQKPAVLLVGFIDPWAEPDE